MSIYDRQEELNLNIPQSIIIIGVGGVGSWIAYNMALVGVKEIHLIDNDKVEETNLNRTPFRLIDIGEYKVMAMKDIIEEHRDDVDVIPHLKKVEDLYDTEIDIMTLTSKLIFDCRDNVVSDRNMDRLEKHGNVIKLGYDGLNYTFWINKNMKEINLYGEDFTYTITPSYLGTPQFLANIITTAVLTDKLPKEPNTITSGNIGELVEKVLSDERS